MSDPLPLLVLFLPLLAAVVITLFLQRNPYLSAGLSVGAVLISFVITAFLVAEFLDGSIPDLSFIWLQVGSLRINFGLHFDALSLLMLIIVTGVGSVIHIYSVQYMRGDPGYPRYFACMSLFTFSMLGIVLSANFFQMFVFWELVGVSSYLLIGFWFEKPAAADAAKKAFLTNRIGDVGFLLGIVLTWSVAGTLNFADLRGELQRNPELFETGATFVGLLIFCGAMGKSAQFPLHVWLPDAMEGPTPVSALIHAATMVAAGVYMLCRVLFMFSGPALHFISWIGAITAVLAALIAIQQDDIKRILAYSTLSQLGYMVMAVGFGEPLAAMFHLTNHAFFKALLFLAAGAIIHGMSKEQDIWKMGSLRKKIPVTYRVFMCGTLALCGLPPFSGFYSKDAILAAAWDHNKTLFWFGIVAAFLTTFYMFRLVFVVFFGQPRSAPAADRSHPKRSRLIAYPLTFLAVFAVGNFLGFRQFIAPQLAPNAPDVLFFEPFEPFMNAPVAARAGLAAFALGLLAAALCYWRRDSDPMPRVMPAISRILRHKFYFDEFYAEVVALFQDLPAQAINFFDQVIQFLVRLIHGTTEWTGRVLRLAQTGNLQTYTLLMAAGVALALFLMLTS
jgi:NADH-quinone oxidoreductase subunit L